MTRRAKMDETRGKTYTARDIADAVAVYADYHHVSTDVVDVTRVYR